MKYILYIALWFVIIDFGYSQNIEYERDIGLSEVKDILLDLPKGVETNKNREAILWGERSRFLLFKGREVIENNNTGRGPGEFVRATAYASNVDYIVVYDDSQSKVIYFDWDGNYVTEFKINEWKVKNIALNPDSDFIAMNEIQGFNQTEAVSIYSFEGNLLGRHGRIPILGLTQKSRNGGGVASDGQGNVYFSYLSSGDIFKYDRSTGETNQFAPKPSYFLSPDPELVKSKGTDHMELTTISFQYSRVSDLLFLSPDKIVQQIEVGNPWGGEEVKFFIEIYNLKGEKIGSKLEIENRIASVWGPNQLLVNQPSRSESGQAGLSSDTKTFESYKFYENE